MGLGLAAISCRERETPLIYPADIQCLGYNQDTKKKEAPGSEVIRPHTENLTSHLALVEAGGVDSVVFTLPSWLMFL